MTASISNVAVQQFKAAFNIEYQASRKLDGIGMVLRGLVGDAYKFKLATSTQMQPRGQAGSVIAANEDISYSAPTITFEDWANRQDSDIFQQAEVNANERQLLAREQALAVGRREDQIFIDALVASATTKTVSVGTTNLDSSKIIEAAKLMNDDEVPMENRHAIVTASQLDSMLRDTKLTSIDYNTVRALMNGTIDTFMGFKFHIIGNRSEGGLPKTGDNRDVYFLHTNSMAMGYRLDPTVDIKYKDEAFTWMVLSRFSAGAVAIDKKGIVKVTCDETA